MLTFSVCALRLAALPVARPVARHGRIQRRARKLLPKRLVVLAAVVFDPCGVRGVLVQVLGGNMVVLTTDHLAETGEERFRLIGASAAVQVAILFAVVDAERVEIAMQGVPVARFIRVHGRSGGNTLDCMGDTIGLAIFNKGHGAATAFTHCDDNATVGVLVLNAAAVFPVFLAVLGANVATDIATINLNIAGKRAVIAFQRHCFAQLVAHYPSRLVLYVEVTGHLQGADTLCSVDEERDSRENVGELQLAAGEDRAAGDAELLGASAALPLATGRDEIRLDRTALRAIRLATVRREANGYKLFPCLLLTHLVHVLELQGAGSGSEKERCLAWHCGKSLYMASVSLYIGIDIQHCKGYILIYRDIP